MVSDSVMKTFEQKLAMLRADFVRSLEGRRAELLGLWGRRARSEEVNGELLHLVHQLHGTAGSYGLRELSAAASRLEQTLKILVEDGADPGEAGQLEQQFHEFIVALESAGDSAGD